MAKTFQVLMVAAVLAGGAKLGWAGEAAPQVPVPHGAPAALRPESLSAEDLYIKGFAEASYQAKDVETTRLFLRLMVEGTQREKMAFIASGGRAYRFPERFYFTKGIVQVNDTVCEWITKTVCHMSCSGWGPYGPQCEQDCHDIIVKSCN